MPLLQLLCDLASSAITKRKKLKIVGFLNEMLRECIVVSETKSAILIGEEVTIGGMREPTYFVIGK